MKGDLERAKSGIVADLAVVRDRGERRVVRTAGADDKLPNAPRGIEIPVIVLRRKPLIVVIMSSQHDIRAGII
jgi:hypothetical protein